MLTNNGFSVCDSVRNRRDWNFVDEYIECRLKIRVIVNAVFEFLANDWNRTDSRESCNHPQLVYIRKIREDSRVQDA